MYDVFTFAFPMKRCVLQLRRFGSLYNSCSFWNYTSHFKRVYRNTSMNYSQELHLHFCVNNKFRSLR